MASYGSGLVKINLSWTQLKSVFLGRNLKLQYDESESAYELFAIDDKVVFLTLLFKSSVPDNSYDQAQNDLDLSDFETNYKTESNSAIIKTSVSGVAGQAPAKGLGGFVPDPTNNPYQPGPDEIVSLYVDGEGSLVTRGGALTDEGSIRDDFTGSSLEVDLTGTLYFTNGSPIVTGVDTLFTEELNRNYYIKAKDDSVDCWLDIVRVPTDTYALLSSPYQGSTGSFVGHKTKWITIKSNETIGDVVVETSKAGLTINTEIGGIYLYREADYLPMISNWRVAVDNRQNNQEVFFGFRDAYEAPSMYCDIIFDSTNNKVIKFRSAWDSDEQLSLITLPVGLTTDLFIQYKIDISPDYCSLLVDGVLVAKHDHHIPDTYASMLLCCGITNTGFTAQPTQLLIDTVFLSNQNLLQIASSFTNPLPVITREDQHSIFSTLTTNSTTADQQIISYEVPTGKLFYIIGYKIDSPDTVDAVNIKIGRNDVSIEPEAPGEVNSNIFRSFFLGAHETTGDIDFGSNPRKLGSAGDTILVTVTPASALPGVWRATIDFVLR